MERRTYKRRKPQNLLSASTNDSRGARVTKRQRDYCLRDFYSIINGSWVRRVQIPPTETRIPQTYYIEQDIHREITALLRRPRHPAIRTFLASWDATGGKDTIIRAISPILTMIQSLETPMEILRLIGWTQRYGITKCPLAIYISGDPRSHTQCRIRCDVPSLGIGLSSYWTDREYGSIRSAYESYCRSLGEIVGVSDIVTEGLAAEKDFGQAYPNFPEVERFDALTSSELRKDYAGIDWDTLFHAYFGDNVKYKEMSVLLESRAWVRHVAHCLSEWPVRRWRSWLLLMVLQWISGMSAPGPLRTAWWTYYKRTLQGMQVDDTPAKLRTSIAMYMLPNTVGDLWVKTHCSRTLKASISRMAETIRQATVKQLRSIPWMSDATKAAAVHKLRHLEIDVCYPDRWDGRETDIILDPADYLQNLMQLSSVATDRMVETARQRGSCDRRRRDVWPVPVYEANAFYFPEHNRFLMPAGLLRPPYYDPTKSLAWNYGGIGATIGHELCHAFDSEGRRYDANGNLHNWWKKEDDRMYRKLSKPLIELYGKTQYRGLTVNGEDTLVENIADLGGTLFALRGLELALGRTPRQKELQEFFISYAVGWRSKERYRRAKQLVDSDPHAPMKLRTNLIVIQLDEWYEAFGVGPECPQYVEPAKRIRLFGL